MNPNVDNSIAVKYGVLTTLKHAELVHLCTRWYGFGGMQYISVCNPLLKSAYINTRNCLSRQYSIGSKTKRQTHQILN